MGVAVRQPGGGGKGGDPQQPPTPGTGGLLGQAGAALEGHPAAALLGQAGNAFIPAGQQPTSGTGSTGGKGGDPQQPPIPGGPGEWNPFQNQPGDPGDWNPFRDTLDATQNQPAPVWGGGGSQRPDGAFSGAGGPEQGYGTRPPPGGHPGGKPGGVAQQPPTPGGGGLVDQVADAYGTPFNYEGLPDVRGTDYDSLPGIGSDVGVRRSDYDSLPGVQRSDYDSLPGVQHSDYSSLPELANPDSYGSEIDRIEKAVYDRALNQLQPQFDRQQNRMNVDLTNRGLPIGSEASADARNRFDDSRGRQLTDLSLASVLAGSQEHGRLADLTSRNRGQLSDEMQQRYSQDFATRGQRTGEMQQRFLQDSTHRGQLSDEMQQRFDQDSGLQAQQFSQSQARRAQLAAEAQDRFAQDMAMRDRLGQERLQERQMPYQELASLLNAAPIPQNPSFAPTSQYGIQSPDFMGLTQANYAAQAQQHSQGQGALSSLIGGLGGAAASGYGSFLGAKAAAAPLLLSDRRLKTDARKVGKLDNGLDVWVFRYKGDGRFQIGVMADEVAGVHPDAVAITPVGFQMVDYERAVE